MSPRTESSETERDAIEKQVAERYERLMSCGHGRRYLITRTPTASSLECAACELVAARLKLAGIERQYTEQVDKNIRLADRDHWKASAESASLKLAAADRLAEAAREYFDSYEAGDGDGEYGKEQHDASLALRSALLEYSRTTV